MADDQPKAPITWNSSGKVVPLTEAEASRQSSEIAVPTPEASGAYELSKAESKRLGRVAKPRYPAKPMGLLEQIFWYSRIPALLILLIIALDLTTRGCGHH